MLLREGNHCNEWLKEDTKECNIGYSLMLCSMHTCGLKLRDTLSTCPDSRGRYRFLNDNVGMARERGRHLIELFKIRHLSSDPLSDLHKYVDVGGRHTKPCHAKQSRCLLAQRCNPTCPACVCLR